MSGSLSRLGAIQEALRSQGVDAWLLYDFRGSNPIFLRILGSSISGRGIVSRRRFLCIPAHGEPSLLVHSIEAGSHTWPWSLRSYTAHDSLVAEIRRVVGRARRVAVEYSPGCALPYASYVDGGTLDLLRSLGFELVSSENLVQEVLARWDEHALESHKAAARLVDETLRYAFRYVREAVAQRRDPTEHEVQGIIVEQFAARDLVADHPPDVAVNAHSGNPHYSPAEGASSPIRHGDWLLIDLWARLDQPGSVYADVTWVAVLASSPREHHERVFGAVADARDAAVDFIRRETATGRAVAGWEVDRVARTEIADAGFGASFTHRTGHNLSPEALHGDGVCLDDFETHDTRLLLPGVGVTVEPGIYLPDFGVRSEINVYMGASGPEVYTPVQERIVCLG